MKLLMFNFYSENLDVWTKMGQCQPGEATAGSQLKHGPPWPQIGNGHLEEEIGEHRGRRPAAEPCGAFKR